MSLTSNTAHAQYTAGFQTNVISAVASNWVSNSGYLVGSNTAFDALMIRSGGVMSNGAGYIGYASRGTNNLAVISGSGAVWSNQLDLTIGKFGGGNSLVISNQSQVCNNYGFVGYNSASSNNSVLVTGNGSVWCNRRDLYVGRSGGRNSLVISNRGQVLNGYGYVGYSPRSSNSVLVTGTGSVWSNSFDLNIGWTGGRNSLVISNRGQVFDGGHCVMGYSSSSSNNTALVTGSGSVLSNNFELYVGRRGAHNSLVISNQGQVINGYSFVGSSSKSINNSVLVTGTGSVWSNQRGLYVGYSGAGNTLSITNGGSVIANSAYVGFNSTSGDNRIDVSSGSLYVTNPAGNGPLELRRGTLTFNGGTITVDNLLVTNGSASVLVLNHGVLNSKGTTVTNGAELAVGNGTASANFHLLGGVHSFNNGLRIRNNAILSGCGTINGAVVVDAGGSVVADCGGTLTFTGIVANNGILRAENGSVLEFFGPFVNNGIIDLLDGTTSFHSTFSNNGTVVNAAAFQIVSLTQEGSNMRISWPSVGGRSYVVQATAGDGGGAYSNNFTDLSPTIVIPGANLLITNYLDVGAIINTPTRFYRVRLMQ